MVDPIEEALQIEIHNPVVPVLDAGFVAHRRSDPISAWVTRLRDRSGWQRAAVALASKNARILWAIMTKGEAFNPKHVTVKPGTAPA